MEDIFNIIIQDKKFLDNVKASVNNIMMDGKVDISDIPEIILLITTTINTFNNLNINESMLPELIKKIFDFIIPDKNPDFDKIVNSAIKLVMFQPIIQKEVKKCCSFFSCFRKKEINKELNTIQIKDDDKIKDYNIVKDDNIVKNDVKVKDDVKDKEVVIIVEHAKKEKIIKVENITKSGNHSLSDIETTSDDDSVIITNDLDDVHFTIKENNVVNTISLLNNNELNKDNLFNNDE